MARKFFNQVIKVKLHGLSFFGVMQILIKTKSLKFCNKNFIFESNNLPVGFGIGNI